MMQNHFAVDIFNKDPEALRVPVDLLVPLEVRSQRQFHAKRRSSDRLDVRCQLQFGELKLLETSSHGYTGQTQRN